MLKSQCFQGATPTKAERKKSVKIEASFTDKNVYVFVVWTYDKFLSHFSYVGFVWNRLNRIQERRAHWRASRRSARRILPIFQKHKKEKLIFCPLEEEILPRGAWKKKPFLQPFSTGCLCQVKACFFRAFDYNRSGLTSLSYFCEHNNYQYCLENLSLSFSWKKNKSTSTSKGTDALPGLISMSSEAPCQVTLCWLNYAFLMVILFTHMSHMRGKGINKGVSKHAGLKLSLEPC